MKTTDELKQFYQQELTPELSRLEDLRKQQVKRQVFMIIAVIVSVVLGLLTMLPFMILVFLAISFILYIVFYGLKRNRPDFKSEYKNVIIKKIMQFIEPGLVYTPYQYIPEAKYEYSRIFLQHPSIYSGSDFVQGTIGETQLQFCELHTQERQTDSRGRTTYVTIFKGLFFIADFNKNFSGQTYVLSDFSERFMGFFGKIFQSMNISRPEVVRLENPDFEKYFAVYSTDQVEARYILSVSFMEKILDFRKKSNSNIQFSFIDSNIYLAVPMKQNFFDPSLYKNVMDFNQVLEYYNQIVFCSDVVDELNLNLRVWNKQ